MRRRRLVATAAASLIITALQLGGATTASAGPGGRAPIITPATGLRAGMMPTHAQATRAAAALTASQTVAGHLTYQGGPVIPNVQVQSVLWGSGTYLGAVDGSASPSLDDYFAHVTDSSYLAWLNEYQTPAAPTGTGQSLDYGSFLGRTQITPASSATPISDTTIQSELISQINAGHLPQPQSDGQGNSETVYALFFPAGKQICDGTDCSGVVFCAYHSTTTTTVNGMHIPYMVLPDAPTMGPGCGAGSDTQNTESYTSHELIETVTDPLVGLAVTLGSGVLAWYDNNNGEIGDLCNAQESTLDSSYTVQKEWSNAANTCIAGKPALTPGTPGSFAATARPGGAVHLSWTAPASTGGTAIGAYVVYRSTTSGRQGVTVAKVTSGTSYDSPPLTDGTTYHYEVAARNGSQVSSPDTAQLAVTADATAPHVSVTSPSAAFQLGTSLTSRYSATDAGSGVASYDVQRRVAAWNGGFGGYRTVASSTTATSARSSGSPGHLYCFRVRARDHAGNVSAWSADRCTAIPLDDRSLTRSSGWSKVADSGAYLGTLTRSSSKNATLTLANASADRLAVVVSTCPTCGKLGVFVGSTLVQTIDTHASVAHKRVVVVTPSFSQRTATVTLKVTTAGKRVSVDGLGISHS